MRISEKSAGFSLIELMMVIAITTTLAAAAITLYVGVREKSRKAAVTRTADGAMADLQHWLQSSLSQKLNSREIDSNMNGAVEMSDKTNGELYNNVAVTYATSRNIMMHESSPWFGRQLWNNDDPPSAGTISLTQTSPSTLSVSAQDRNGMVILRYTVAAE